MADTDLELAAQRVRQLEAEAIAMHDLAQRLNKEGRFEEAQAAYASMHRLEDEASRLAARVGCVACVLGEPGQQSEQASLCSLDPTVLVPYQELHPALPWPRSRTRADAGSEQSQSQQQQPLGVEWGLLEARALGCVVGSALADAAAMGVHWVYDLAVLDEIELERRQQALAAAGNPPSASSPAALEHPFSFGLEFTDPPRSPFYSYASGRNSPYGEQTLVLLRSLAEGSGSGGASDGGGSGGRDAGGVRVCCPGLHCGHYAELFSQTFGPESGFDGYRDVSTKGFLRNYGRGFPPPLTGANDAQANCIARLAPLVAAFGASPASSSPGASSSSSPPCPTRASVPSSTATSAPAATAAGVDGANEAPAPAAPTAPADDPLLRCVELATRVTQNTDAAVAWASAGAVVLERLLMGSTAEAAVRHVVHDLESRRGRLASYVRDLAPEIAAQLARALELRTTPVPAAVAALGRNCHMPNALQTPLQVVMHVEYLAAQVQAEARREPEKEKGAEGGDGVAASASGGEPWVGGAPQLPAEAYTWGVRLAVREGGCCASRAAYVGACLGAMVAAAPGGGQLAGLPAGWLARYPAAAEVRSWAETVLAARRRAAAA